MDSLVRCVTLCRWRTNTQSMPTNYASAPLGPAQVGIFLALGRVMLSLWEIVHRCPARSLAKFWGAGATIFHHHLTAPAPHLATPKWEIF